MEERILRIENENYAIVFKKEIDLSEFPSIRFHGTNINMKMAMAAVLKATSLTTVGVMQTSIKMEDFNLIVGMLKMNTVLKHLDISHNYVPFMCDTLVDALKVNNTLEILNISRCRLKLAGLKSLITAIKVNTMLSVIDMSGNWINKMHTTELVDFLLFDNKTLLEVRTTFRDNASEGCRKLIANRELALSNIDKKKQTVVDMQTESVTLMGMLSKSSIYIAQNPMDYFRNMLIADIEKETKELTLMENRWDRAAAEFIIIIPD